jgi:hypothetical protein
VPEHLNGDDFLDLLKESLAPGGAIAYNRLADTVDHAKESQEYYEGSFKEAFPEGELVNTGGNFMLVNEARFLLE